MRLSGLAMGLGLAALAGANAIPKRGVSDYLHSAGLTDANIDLFTYSMEILDNSFSLPLLWKTPKLSAWYAVGLLARNQGDDADVANKLIANTVTKQFTDPSFIAYGTFVKSLDAPYSDGNSLWKPEIYKSYDPNNALFVTIASIIIDSQFSELLEDSVLQNLRKAMYTAVVGDGYRVGGENGENLFPAYSNPWFMRCVSAAYVGNLFGDANMTQWADTWAQEGIDLFDRYGTISEFNGGTYAGVTLFALSIAQYTPQNSTIYKAAPRLLGSIWDQIAETYNPSLNTLAGPWDRSYGFDLTQYFGIIGSAITGIIGRKGDGYPIPNPLDGSSHYTDMAIIPMQMLTAPYVESQISSTAKSKLASLYGPHAYTAQAISPPFDLRPRNYTFWLEDGLSVGGVSFDESVVGGPSISQTSFSPGVVQWYAGNSGAGVGWISYYPTNPSCEILATSSNLTIRYLPSISWPNSTTSNSFQLSISTFADFQLNKGSFANGTASLPGMDVEILGNVYEKGNMSLQFSGSQINGFYYYNLTYAVPDELLKGDEVPELVVSFTKTSPPEYNLFV